MKIHTRIRPGAHVLIRPGYSEYRIRPKWGRHAVGRYGTWIHGIVLVVRDESYVVQSHGWEYVVGPLDIRLDKR